MVSTIVILIAIPIIYYYEYQSETVICVSSMSGLAATVTDMVFVCKKLK